MRYKTLVGHVACSCLFLPFIFFDYKVIEKSKSSQHKPQFYCPLFYWLFLLAMAKELYLYSPIFSFTAEELISQLDANLGNEVVIRSNSPGGSVFSGWGIIAKMKEHGNVTVKVDGIAASMAAFMLIFADKVEALDVSKIMIHRADMETSDEESKKFLKSINDQIKSKLVAKVDVEKLKEISGYSVDEIFAEDKRIDVWLSAKEAKQIGLVDEIVSLDPKEIKALTERFFNVAAQATTTQIVKPENQIKMTIEKLKAEHPELFNQVQALGAASEKDRVQAWLTFVDIDADAVKKGIDTDKAPSLKEQAELNRKLMSAEAIVKIEAGSPAPVATEEIKPEGVNSDLVALEAQIDKNLKLNK